jgi:hypothetical protein
LAWSLKRPPNRCGIMSEEQDSSVATLGTLLQGFSMKNVLVVRYAKDKSEPQEPGFAYTCLPTLQPHFRRPSRLAPGHLRPDTPHTMTCSKKPGRLSRANRMRHVQRHRMCGRVWTAQSGGILGGRSVRGRLIRDGVEMAFMHRLRDAGARVKDAGGPAVGLEIFSRLLLLRRGTPEGER